MAKSVSLRRDKRSMKRGGEIWGHERKVEWVIRGDRPDNVRRCNSSVDIFYVILLFIWFCRTHTHNMSHRKWNEWLECRCFFAIRFSLLPFAYPLMWWVLLSVSISIFAIFCSPDVYRCVCVCECVTAATITVTNVLFIKEKILLDDFQHGNRWLCVRAYVCAACVVWLMLLMADAWLMVFGLALACWWWWRCCDFEIVPHQMRCRFSNGSILFVGLLPRLQWLTSQLRIRSLTSFVRLLVHRQHRQRCGGAGDDGDGVVGWSSSSSDGGRQFEWLPGFCVKTKWCNDSCRMVRWFLIIMGYFSCIFVLDTPPPCHIIQDGMTQCYTL